MLFAPTLADKAILPTAWEGRYFFNRIGRFPPVETDASRPEAAGQWVTTKKGAIQLVWNPPQHFKGYAAGVAWKHALHAQLQTRLVETTVVVY
ncbi:hypothetical protein [Stutzerimonas sp.]|uniref:hypothetical protein n=1 Tax=Stutzerimonas sp. TaxID=2901166 RepID=UPI0035B39242